MVLSAVMKSLDFDVQRGEEEVSLADFVKFYNEDVPLGYPNATAKSLAEFKNFHPNLFKENDMWSLIKHRKHLMDWLQRKTRPSV